MPCVRGTGVGSDSENVYCVDKCYLVKIRSYLGDKRINSIMQGTGKETTLRKATRRTASCKSS